MALPLPTQAACIFFSTPDTVIDIGMSLGMGTNNTAELYALGMLFTELTHLCLRNSSILVAHVFCDSKLALSAVVSKKAPLTNGALTRAVRIAYAALPTSLRIELHWIRGHSSVGGNERVDRISKTFASIALNDSAQIFNASFPAICFTKAWIPGFPLTGLPTSVFISELPVPPASRTGFAPSAPVQIDIDHSDLQHDIDLTSSVASCVKSRIPTVGSRRSNRLSTANLS